MKNFRQLILLGILFFFTQTFINRAYSATFYVDAAIAAPGNGATWATAFDDLQSAINAATSGDIIRVSQGVYNTTNGFVLADGINIMGGHPPSGAYINMFRNMFRNPDLYPTVLDGNNITMISNVGLSSQTVINGFTINGATAGIGTAGLTQAFSPSIVNCKFTGGDYGIQAVNIWSTYNPTIVDCEFENGIAGILLDCGTFGAGQNIQPNISKSTFKNMEHGVVFQIISGRFAPTFDRCEFAYLNGHAVTNDGTGIGNGFAFFPPPANSFSYSPTFKNSVFYNNGGILEALVSDKFNQDVSTLFLNCTFYKNNEPAGSTPILIETDQSNFTSNQSITAAKFHNCISWGNKNSSGKLIKLETAMTVQFRNSLVDFNTFNSSSASIDPAFTLTNPGSTIQVQNLMGNINNQNPQFVYASSTPSAAYLFQLKPISPARNQGNNALQPTTNQDVDFRGYIRTNETTIDMGAFEYCPQSTGCPPSAVSNPGGGGLGPVGGGPLKTSIEENPIEAATPSLNVYPIPAQNEIIIDGYEAAQGTVRLFDLTGKQVAEQILQESSTRIDISGLPNGVYILRIKDTNGVSSKRIIKE